MRVISRSLVLTDSVSPLERPWVAHQLRPGCRLKKIDITTERQQQAQHPRGARHALAVERTNSWLSIFGQMRRNTDRFTHHRLDTIALAVAIKLIK